MLRKQYKIGCTKLNVYLISLKLCLAFNNEHKLTNLVQTAPDVSNDLKPLELVIKHKFIKSILNGYECNGTEKKLFRLPVRNGGFFIYDPTERSQIEFENSRLVTHTLVEKVKNYDEIYNKSIEKNQQKYHAEIKKQKCHRNC